MSNRGAFLLFLLLPLAGKSQSIPVQTAALQVQVYDYSGLSAAALVDFVTHTQQILTSAGISVEVSICPRGGSALCEGQRGSFRQVVIRVVAGTPPNPQSGRWQHLGQSIASHDGGVYATVYRTLVEAEAAEANLSAMVLLSYAAAHEAGHLLLGDQAHAPEGLMKARWVQEDFQAMAQNRLHFSPQQCQELHRRYGSGRRADFPSEMSIAAKH